MSITVRNALRQTSSLAVPVDDLAETDDLFAAGLSSFDLINLIVYLEEVFGFEFPGDVMTRDHFATVACINQTIALLDKKEAVP